MSVVNDLKEQIMKILDDIELGDSTMLSKQIIEICQRAVPMMLLSIKTPEHSLEEMKKAIKELQVEKKIIVFSDSLSGKIAKYMNQASPSKETFSKALTEDEDFIFSYVLKSSPE